MTEGIDFENSYTSTTDADALRIIISRAAQHNLWLYFYDVSNAFQTNVIEDPSKRHHLSLPPLYKQWFSQRWSNHPLLIACTDWKTIVMQTLRNIQ